MVPTSSPYYRLMDPETGKGPLNGATRELDGDWVLASRGINGEHYYKKAVLRDRSTLAAKLRIMQEYHWVALVREVEKRTERNEDGSFIRGGWQRNDMLGMMDWYRDCWQLPTWQTVEMDERSVNTMYNDGVWLTVLFTSPWAKFRIFDQVKGRNRDMLKTRYGEVHIGRRGLPDYETLDHESDAKAEEFLDLWVSIANRIPLKKHPNGDVITPYTSSGLR